MTDRPLVGLVCALFVEARHWIKLRWDFNDASYESAWQLSFVMMILTAVMIWLDESRYTAVLVLMGWLPPILMPLQFVQGYGLRDSIQLTTFSLLARRSRLRTQRLGLIHKSVAFNFGNVTFVVTLLSSAVSMETETQLFLPGLLVLCGWMLMATGRCRLKALVPLLLVSGALGLAGEHGLNQLEKWLRRGGGGTAEGFNPNFQRTQIGKGGRVLQSSDVIWRLTTKPGEPPPALLKTATYTNFLGVNWQNQQFPFEELETRTIQRRSHYMLDDQIKDETVKRLPNFRMRGSVQSVFAMPIAGSTASLVGPDNAEVEMNLIGMVRVRPDASVVEADVFWGAPDSVDGEVRRADMSSIQPLDREVIHQVTTELGLAELPDLKSKLEHLRQWYLDEFRYTLDLTIRQAPAISRLRPDDKESALTQFLTDVRAGHCEYFATSATLILRSAGVPARYAVGFGVMEKSSKANEYLIRGTHAHAWVRVWDEENQQWIDFDPTPPDWMGSSSSKLTLLQSLKDWVKRVREDFFLWRTKPENEIKVAIGVGVIGLVLALVVVRRLWRSRSRLEEKRMQEAYEGVHEDTPLHELEELVKRCIGPRPTGMTYASWLQGIEGRYGSMKALQEAIVLHQQWRFDPQPVVDSKRERLRQLVSDIEIFLNEQVSQLEEQEK